MGFIVGLMFYLAIMISGGSRPLAGMSLLIEKVGTEKVMECLPVKSIDEYEILCRIVEAEATGGTIKQKENVTSCILNRVASNEFPDTIEDVVFDKGQFSPISDGRYYKVAITKETEQAVSRILWKGSQHDCLYFCSDCKSYRSGWFSKLEESFYDGVHHYFTGKKKK